MKKSINLVTGAEGEEVKTAIRSDYNLNARPKLTVDWNWNRYATPTATNTPLDDDEGFDIDVFPIESIVEPLRPNKGVSKARVNQAIVADGYARAKDPKFYIASTEDVYKYWTSPYTTDTSGNFPLHTDGLTSARPRVTYDRVVKTNKIIIRLENTWASPKTYEVRIATTLGGSIGASPIGGSNPSIAKDGTITLYYNGTAWVSEKPTNLVTTDVSAIELRVSQMGPGIKRNGYVMTYSTRTSQSKVPTTGGNSSLNVIAIEAHFETDLTNRLINVSDDFDMSDKSELYPIGTTTSNKADISLSNEDGVFNKENTSSIYYGLTEANAKFNLEYIYIVGGIQHSVQEFVMYSDGNWSGSDGTVGVSLTDYSKFLDESKPNSFMVENKTTPELIWRVLDMVGFVDYEIQESDLVIESVIPVFWTDGEKTVWEVLSELATATQTAIYFDNFGKLQVKTRQQAFKETGIDWSLYGIKSGTSLPDIVSWQPSSEYEANTIAVKYKATKWKLNSLGKDATSVVWAPETDVSVLRSSPLTSTLDGSSTHLFVNQKDAITWPYSSKVQIDGEIIEYEGKQFVYYTYSSSTNETTGVITYSSGGKVTKDVKSADEYNKLNRVTPVEYRYRNYFTGGLRIKERATWNSEEKTHSLNLSNWSTKYELKAKSSATSVLNPYGFNQQPSESTATINTPNAMVDADDTYWAFRGQSGASGYKSYGTRFKFNESSSNTTQIAGLCYQLNTSRENGYYVEVKLSARLSAKDRATNNEVTIYSRKNGVDTVIAKGSAVLIGKNIWYDLDIYHSGSGNTQGISAWINGQKVAHGTTNASTAQSDGGRFGLFARGRTNISFEYIFAVARNIREPADDYGFFDLKYGAARGGAWEREHVWELGTRWKKIRKHKWKKETYKHNQYVFDEFGPYVHEIREFDVTFDPAPVRYSYLFNTNTWYSSVLEYTSTPFGSKFIIANTGRSNAVIHGDDSLTYAGSNASINQVSVVLGQNLEIADDEIITRTNKYSVRVRGKIESELSSDWIQTKAMAEELAIWMNRHWSESVDEVEAEIIGNPLIELGDVVDVEYPLQNATSATHQYFVVGVKNSFDMGLKTTLTLRRRRLSRDAS